MDGSNCDAGGASSGGDHYWTKTHSRPCWRDRVASGDEVRLCPKIAKLHTQTERERSGERSRKKVVPKETRKKKRKRRFSGANITLSSHRVAYHLMGNRLHHHHHHHPKRRSRKSESEHNGEQQLHQHSVRRRRRQKNKTRNGLNGWMTRQQQ